jgi:hypothetical protein
MEKTEQKSEVFGGKSQHELYVEGLMLGKSRRQAALDAGFSGSQAANPRERIERLMSAEIVREALARRSSGQACKSRRELYVEGLMDGKTRRRAALDAGFSVSQAEGAKSRIEGPITQALILQALMQAGVTLRRLSEKIDEGLDATRVQTVSGGSGKPATLELVADFETRLKYIQQACKVLGFGEAEQREVPEFRVNIVDVGGGPLRDANGEIVR